jgi:hypothetical protein
MKLPIFYRVPGVMYDEAEKTGNTAEIFDYCNKQYNLQPCTLRITGKTARQLLIDGVTDSGLEFKIKIIKK